MMRKLQIFISSTFSDLKKERQACVEAILRAGHIPAGMELFSAGDESQLDVIKRWIEVSDIYMLLLGSRYGSIEPKSGLSYTEIEYRYAVALGKPLFALVMTEDFLDEKVGTDGKEILELNEPQKFKEFKSLVLSRISRFFGNENEIKLAILESIIDIQNRNSLSGWVKASEVPDTTAISNQISELTERNKSLEQKLLVIETSRADKSRKTLIIAGNQTAIKLIDVIRQLGHEVVALYDKNPDAEGVKYAREKGIHAYSHNADELRKMLRIAGSNQEECYYIFIPTTYAPYLTRADEIIRSLRRDTKNIRFYRLGIDFDENVDEAEIESLLS